MTMAAECGAERTSAKAAGVVLDSAAVAGAALAIVVAVRDGEVEVLLADWGVSRASPLTSPKAVANKSFAA